MNLSDGQQDLLAEQHADAQQTYSDWEAEQAEAAYMATRSKRRWNPEPVPIKADCGQYDVDWTEAPLARDDDGIYWIEAFGRLREVTYRVDAHGTVTWVCEDTDDSLTLADAKRIHDALKANREAAYNRMIEACSQPGHGVTHITSSATPEGEYLSDVFKATSDANDAALWKLADRMCAAGFGNRVSSYHIRFQAPRDGHGGRYADVDGNHVMDADLREAFPGLMTDSECGEGHAHPDFDRIEAVEKWLADHGADYSGDEVDRSVFSPMFDFSGMEA